MRRRPDFMGIINVEHELQGFVGFLDHLPELVDIEFYTSDGLEKWDKLRLYLLAEITGRLSIMTERGFYVTKGGLGGLLHDRIGKAGPVAGGRCGDIKGIIRHFPSKNSAYQKPVRGADFRRHSRLIRG